MTRNTPKQVVATSFKYDPFGRRIEKRVATTNILSTKTSVIIHEYLYDNEDIVEEIITKPRPQRDIVEETRFVHGPGIDEPLAFSGKQGEYFFHADGLGSITALTDHGGGLAQRYEYSAFGTRKKHDSGVDSFYSYTGREWDSETGLYYYRARYYDSAAGRFIGKDPIGFAGGDVNLYRYVQNNPVNFIDPFGLRVLNPKNYSVSPQVMDALWGLNRQIGCNKDIVITGGDRDPSSRLGAGSTSTHTQGIAADISVQGQSHLETANQANESGLFGGVGWYEEGYRGPNGEGPHTHVDLRKGKSLWGYPANGPRMRGYFPPYAVRLNKENCSCLRD